MDLLLFSKTLLGLSHCEGKWVGKDQARRDLFHRGESGEIVLPLVLVLLTASFLFGSLFWLNTHFEKKTKEHLNDFRKDWQTLEGKYKDETY